MKGYNAKGEKHGLWEAYYSDGKLYYRFNYVNGELHGHWEWYFSNGQLDSKGQFANGQHIGLWIRHCYSGKQFFEFYL
jgi:antitoxin component YwqK of YwqJK toxin-antitoxin module